MTQPTDEAAVDIDLQVIRDLAALPRNRRLREQEDEALIVCANEIESLRAQLTTANADIRRFKALADDHFRNSRRIAEEVVKTRHRAETAEKILRYITPTKEPT